MPAPKKNSKEPTVETMLGELEKLVSQMESGELSLEQSVDAYRKGSEIAANCQKKLSVIRQEIDVLDVQTQQITSHSADSLI